MNTYKFIVVLIFTFISYNVAYSPVQGMIDYYVELIKTEPYKNLYEHIIYIKE